MAYLDKTTCFLSNKENVIKLNPSKCLMRAFKEIRGEGMKMMGTMHALLLLKFSLQQNIRHLQRSLKTDNLGGEWQKMDD
ncbi:hypothetical protein I350_07355 [Cryptococcus amylolentus CBS 6273]|uniref:Uncharacterized protein n=1 Tax=Cryptococcus amylolentus CBS 6273 TaxID=1296118 RepID=A0A1E3JGE4_9TREE|nr:hypothetical protein I350_07355 [Cryptococcus amylolentus CBS 6273]